MSLREPDDRRSGRRSRDPSPAYYDDRQDRRSSRYDDRQYERDDEPRYARAEKTSEVPYAGKKTASFAMPGGFDDDDRFEKKEVRYEVKKEEDPMAYGDKNARGSKYDDKKFAEPTKKYYDDEPPRRESKKYYEEPKYQHEPERERSRERSSKQYYEDERRYEQAPKRGSQYYEREETETRYAVSKPSKYESSPKPKYVTPVYAPSVAAATKGSTTGGHNPNYYSDEDSSSDSGKSDGKTGDRRIDIELDIKHHDKSDVTVRRRPSRKKQYHLEESSSALVTTTTTTSGARLDSRYEEQGRYGYAAPSNAYDRPSGRPVSVDYDGTRYESQPQRPGYGSARQSETRVETINGKKTDLDVITAEPGHRRQRSSVGGLGANLIVAGGAAAGLSLSQAPGSPMLEAYRGTYQSMGSMPSPLMMPSSGFSLSQDVAILDLNRAPSPSGRERRARFRDLTKDAETLKVALRGTKTPDPRAFIEILPSLSHEEILDLRKEYKLQVKTPDHRGVNIAKHIKMRLKEDKLFLKCCYTTALGRWESEGYWANSYYNSSQTSGALLIESLMGRSNEEIRRIKDGFKDKKYSDDLVKCMKTELKEDKFKKAVLLVLKEQKMEESRRIDSRKVEEDVRELYRAIRSERGGETAMMEIVVMRSEAHMREVINHYAHIYRANLAKDILAKSGNLVVSPSSHIPINIG